MVDEMVQLPGTSGTAQMLAGALPFTTLALMEMEIKTTARLHFPSIQ